MTFPFPTASTRMVVQSIRLVSLTDSRTEVEAVTCMRGRYNNGEGMVIAGESRERPLVKSVRSVNVGKGWGAKKHNYRLIIVTLFASPTNFFSSNKRVSVGFTVCLSRNVNVALSLDFVYFSSSSTGQFPGFASSICANS